MQAVLAHAFQALLRQQADTALLALRNLLDFELLLLFYLQLLCCISSLQSPRTDEFSLAHSGLRLGGLLYFFLVLISILLFLELCIGRV
jgi:hypothetical protein